MVNGRIKFSKTKSDVFLLKFLKIGRCIYNWRSNDEVLLILKCLKLKKEKRKGGNVSIIYWTGKCRAGVFKCKGRSHFVFRISKFWRYISYWKQNDLMSFRFVIFKKTFLNLTRWINSPVLNRSFELPWHGLYRVLHEIPELRRLLRCLSPQF